MTLRQLARLCFLKIKMTITNFKNLAKNPLRQKALLIAEAGYKAIEISRVIHQKIKLKENQLVIILASINGSKKLKLNLNDYPRIFLIGIGKGSALACATLAKILGKKLTGGIALDIQKPKLEIRNLKLEILAGTHPLPSQKNVNATQKIIKLAKRLNKDDLLITFICGGGSALACASKTELKASQTIFKELTKKGADIIELNTVRKHLSELKGGNLAKLAYPATVVSLIISDVPGNDLSMVASGPTVFDKTAKKDAIRILKEYNFQFPISNFQLLETSKDRKFFNKVKNILFLSNQEPVLAMAKKAEELGFKPKIYSLKIQGEAKKSLLPLMEAIKKNEAILAAGETTVTLDNRPTGRGGRNMEAVLGALTKSLNSKFYILNSNLVMSFASDGRDNTEAAGAIGDILTLKKAQKLKLNFQEFLNKHNSFSFFKKTGDLIFAKQKTFNVSDLVVVLKE